MDSISNYKLVERAEDEESNLIWLYVTGGILVLLTIVSVIFLIVQRRRSIRKGYWSIPSKERLGKYIQKFNFVFTADPLLRHIVDSLVY